MSKSKYTGSILIADDEVDFRLAVESLLISQGHHVTVAEDGGSAINFLQKNTFDIVLLDVKMPRIDGIEVLSYVKEQFFDTEVIMLSGVSDLRIAVDCMKRGAFYYLTKPFSTDELLSLVQHSLDRKNLSIENKVMKSELSRIVKSSNLIGESPEFLKVMELASKIAPTESTVLIEGASGTGKELIASFLHKNSERSEKPFVALNCASIPDTLIESEIFGHEKGAFTDAVVTKQGLVEIANGGTLFLDEIGEISSAFQPKLLRFIQTGEYRRVGGTKNFHSGVRIISATNRNLIEEVKGGNFREDLFYRLNVITLHLPTLAERKSDIPLLAGEILKRKLGTKKAKQLHPTAMKSLMEYDWPGNVRELENVLERSLIISNEDIIYPKDLALPARYAVNSQNSGNSNGKIGTAVTIEELEKEHISTVLLNSKWNKNLTAKILGISLKTLYTKIQKFQLVEPQ